MRTLGNAVLLSVMTVTLTASAAIGAHVVLAISEGAVIAPEDSSSTPRTLLAFDVSAIPAGSVIDLALVRASCTVDDNSTEVGAVNIFAYPVTTDWTSDAAWESPWVSAGGDWDSGEYCSWTVATGSSKELVLDVTEIVEEWLRGAMENYGLILKATEGMDGSVILSGVAGSVGEGPVVEIWFARPDRASAEKE